MNILVVEDERNLADAIVHILEGASYHAEACYDGRAGLRAALAGGYDAVVLDIMLPGMDGLEVVHELRRHGSSVPVLLLTARTATQDKVEGLDSGADDYMTKPFVYEELFARVRALTRRVGEVVYEALSFGDLTLDLEKAELRCGEKAVHLGYKEFAIMKRFLQHPQLSISKEELIVSVWGSDSDAGENNVEVYISFLRKKLHFLGSRVQIVTMRRIGYRIEDTAS